MEQFPVQSEYLVETQSSNQSLNANSEIDLNELFKLFENNSSNCVFNINSSSFTNGTKKFEHFGKEIKINEEIEVKVNF